MSKYSLKVCRDLSQVNPEEWDSLVQKADGSIFYTYNWLKSYTNGAPHQSKSSHILAYHDHQLCGILPAYLTQACPRLTAHRKYLVKSEPNFQEPLLLAHSLYSYYGGPLCIRGDSAVAVAMLKFFENLAREEKIEVYGIVNYGQNDDDLIQYFQKNGYIARYLSATMCLPIVWSSFEEYLRHLNGKYRHEIRRKDRNAEKNNLSAQFTAGFRNLDDMLSLMNQILVRHGHIDTNLYPRSYLEAIAEDMGDSVKCLQIFDPHDKLICSLLVLDDGVRLTPWVAGIDYESFKVFEPYHFAYRWLIHYAIEHHYKEIDFGRSSYEFKQKYGCRKRPLYLVLNTCREELRPEIDRWSKELALFESGPQELLWETREASA